MDLGILGRGVVIGFSIAAPIGPIGILCIHRTLLRGRKSGIVSGLGAATADALYGSIAGFGLTFLTSFLFAYQVWLRLFGGLFLCYLGAKIVCSRVDEKSSSEQNRSSDYSSTFILTLTNPLTILSFAAFLAGLSASSALDYGLAGVFVLGIFLGSTLWWTILTSIAGFFIRQINPKKLGLINKISGIVIVGFGGFFLLSLYHMF